MGGASRRFGSDKAAAMLDGVPLGRRVADCARAAGVDPVVAVGGSAGGSLGLVTIADEWPGAGPLAGLTTVLRWAPTTHVLVLACDLVGLAPEAVAALVERWRTDAVIDSAVVAAVGDRPEPTVGIWPTAWRRAASKLVDGGQRRLMSVCDLGEVSTVELEAGFLSDADTPEDLSRHGGCAQ